MQTAEKRGILFRLYNQYTLRAMNSMRLISLVLAYLFTAALTNSNAMASDTGPGDLLRGKTIRVCGDGAEWPPYHYYKRVNGNVTKEVTGFSVELLEAIFNPNGLKIEVELPPWKRCLSDTKSGKYQIALDSSFNEERARTYLLSAQHYALTPAYFYLKTANPEGLSVDRASELWNKGSVCGLFSYNYEGFAPGVDNSNIDLGAKTFKELIEKTKKGRCNTFLARLEILTGFSAIGTDYLQGQFGYHPLPDGEVDPFYLLISRQYEFKYELKELIDTGLARLRKEGVLKVLLEKYLAR